MSSRDGRFSSQAPSHEKEIVISSGYRFPFQKKTFQTSNKLFLTYGNTLQHGLMGWGAKSHLSHVWVLRSRSEMRSFFPWWPKFWYEGLIQCKKMYSIQENVWCMPIFIILVVVEHYWTKHHIFSWKVDFILPSARHLDVPSVLWEPPEPFSVQFQLKHTWQWPHCPWKECFD